MNYLIRMKPCEPYTFGTEQDFRFPGIDRMGKETYFVLSKDMPEQTTILGMLRYMILEEKGLLRSDFQYTEAEKKQIEYYIGSESFHFSSENKQSFGLIHSVSPVFLIDDKGDYYIKNPFHNKSDNGYDPMKIEEKIMETSEGRICLPKEKEYNPKDGYGEGYYNLTYGCVRKDLFQSEIVVGNRKNGKEETDEDSFFKRETKILQNGFSIAVFIEAERFPDKGFAYMGLKKSLFQVTAEEVKRNDLIDKVEKAFEKGEEPWQYALSDIVIYDVISYDTFCIVEKKEVRNLKTSYEMTNYVNQLKRSNIQYNLIQSGSVFYRSCGLNLKNENCRQIGYNQMVQLGGR